MRTAPLLAVLVIASASLAQNPDHCWIKYTHDAAGNRIHREWWCGDPDEAEHESEPKSVSSNGFGVHAAPNPATATLTIRFDVPPEEEIHIEVLSISGQLMESRNATKAPIELDVSSYSNGAYSLHLHIGNSEYVKRFNVLH